MAPGLAGCRINEVASRAGTALHRLIGVRMFARYADRSMSASTPLATVERTFQNRRFVPFASFCAAINKAITRSPRRLFDHFVGGGEQCRRDGEAECLSGLEVDDHFELGR
jgi:hypothetical protein